MSIPRPCTRHARNVWLACCADCTAWHLAHQTPAPGRPGLRRSPDPGRLGRPVTGVMTGHVRRRTEDVSDRSRT